MKISCLISKWMLVLILSIYPLHFATGQTIYVDANATGANNGTSWADAYKYLQDALTAAEPDYQIWVAQGIYRPDEDSNNSIGTDVRTSTFQLKNGVSLYGGFPVGGSSWSVRDPYLHQTILSGDLNNNDVYVNDPCDLFTDPCRTDNSYHVVTGSNTDATAIFEGFTITAGHADGGLIQRMGGGLHIRNGNPTITNCTFRDNFAYQVGGGIYDYNSDSKIANCIITGNFAALDGGGISTSDSNPIIINCTFIGNSSGLHGGGMVNMNYGNPIVTNCIFTGNSTLLGGSGGGGIYNNSNSNPTVTNCTFTGNSSVQGGGMYNFFSSPTLSNCIFWGDTASSGENEIYDGNSSSVITYSDVQGGWVGIGNIDTNPLFVDANGPDDIIGTEDDNLHLLSNSPCIDTGDNIIVPADIADLDGDANTTEPTPLDLDLRLRFLNGDCSGSIVIDMGAYEFGYVGDFDCDNDVDFIDFAIFANSWLQNDPLRNIVPLDIIVDIEDLAIFCDNWLSGE